MGLYENIKKLCKERNCSINKLEQELGFARSSIMKFNQNSPSVTKIQQIADYLCVSVDDVVNGSNKNPDNIMIEQISKLDESRKVRLAAYLQALIDTQEK